MNAIARRLKAEIEQQGTLSFARFMELALYSPAEGYYERDSSVIGHRGDFYSSISTGSLFGELLAAQFAEWLDELPARSVQIVEAGAHDGQLAADILACLGRKRPQLLERLEYWIIEPSPTRQAWQRNKLADFSRLTRWLAQVLELPRKGVQGVVFSNELLDAFPRRRLGWDSSTAQWFEWGVAAHLDQFVWERMPIAEAGKLAEELADAGMDLPAEVLAVLPDGFTVEVCPTAGSWWKQTAQSLQCGKLMTLDYGNASPEWLLPERPHGTLRAYRRHRLSDNVLADPGEQDLTAHVNFTQIQRAGELAGLQTEGLYSQAQFLTRIVEKVWPSESATASWNESQLRQFKTLTHPEHLGRAFKVLVQTRRAHA